MSENERIKQLKDKQGMSFRQISEITGIDRKTASKWYKSKDFPKYQRSKQSTPVKDEIIPQLKIWIEEDIIRIKKGKLNRIRTAAKMYEDLVSMNIKCSESTVRNYVRKLKPKEVFIEWVRCT